jgi:hypothetical protein
MWTSRRIKLAIAGCVLLCVGLGIGFAVARIGSGGEEKAQTEAAKPKLAEIAGVAAPQWQTPPPPVSAGSVAAQQLAPPVYLETQTVPQHQQPPPQQYQQQFQPQVIDQPPQENYWADRPIGRNGLIGNPCADPPSAHGAAYSRAY